MIKRIFGTILIILGLLVIGFGLYRAFEVFEGKREAPVLFSAPKLSKLEGEKISSFKGGGSPQQFVEKVLEKKLTEILPPEFLPKFFNLFAFSIFIGILFYGGGKIADIGVKLLR